MSCLGAVDLTFEAILDQSWKVAGMIYMGMGKHNRINGRRVHGKLRPIAPA